MNIIKFITTVSCAGLCLVVGCGQQSQMQTIERICLPDSQQAKAIEKIEDVLGQMHFRIAKLDPQAGYIKTMPLRGAQFFEFWRKDNVGKNNWGLSNLHTIRRTVEIQLSTDNGLLCIDCDVLVQRLSLTDSAIEKNRGGLQRIRVDATDKSWLDLGHDEKLETFILKEIENNIKN